jgi:DNA primase
MISQRTIEQVLDAARIEEVVGDFVSLKRRGTSLIGLCPFHNEKTPSFNVSTARGIYKCFGCGQGGNSLRFVMEHEKLSYPEAIRYLAKKYQINVEETAQSDEVKEELRDRESMLLLNEWACSFMENELHHTEYGQSIGYAYFKERGFTDETIRTFKLGISPEGWAPLTETAQKEGYLKDFLVKTGLSVQRDDGSLFDRFRGRVMFPIQNNSGRIIGFGGRILTNDKKVAKYVNSPESEVYHKSAVLYGIYQARKAITELDEVLLVEGYTDVISLYQNGIHHAVASSGTSLTQDQIKILRRYTQNVTILYDGDSAGIKASFRGIDMLLQEGMNVKIVLFPDGEDPDSFARQNTPVYIREYIRSEARDFVAFKTSVLAEEAGSDPIKKTALLRDIIASLALIPDPVLRALYIKDCSKRLDMDEQVLILELNRQLSHRASSIKVPPTSPEAPQETEAPPLAPLTGKTYRAEEQERGIVRILVRYANELIHFDELNEENEKVTHAVRVGDFILTECETDGLLPEHPLLAGMYRFAASKSGAEYPSEREWLHHAETEWSAMAVDLVSERYQLSTLWSEMHQIFIPSESDKLKKLVLEAIYAFKLKHVQIMERDVHQQLEQPNNPESEDLLMMELIKLQEVRKILAQQLAYVIL